MPTWSGVLHELHDSTNKGKNPPQFDEIRRKYLASLHAHTQRDVILYATKFTQRDPDIPPDLLSIVDEDVQGLMEVIHGLTGPNLDLILHSPGGSLEAAEAFVDYLRSKFTHIRVIVPQLAQSAATMIACAANEIVMGKHSSLGPTDPQVQVRTTTGATFAPAQAILDQFETAVRECQDPKKLIAWAPMLAQYGPHLLAVCENVTKLSRELVAEWLHKYMFAGAASNQTALEISEWLSNHGHFKTHGRHISRDQLKAKGMKISFLEDDQDLQEWVLSVFHATTQTLTSTGAVKIIENQLGKAFVKQQQRVFIQQASTDAPKPGGQKKKS